MPATVSIIDTLTTPSLAYLQQVLDTGGPYTGDNTLTTFHTSGGFLLPAGTYDVSGTYGVLVEASTFPLSAGRLLGWNDASFPTLSGDTYQDRIAQVNLLHQLPLTGAWIITATFDIFMPTQLCLWPVYIGSGAKIGLHVFPNFAVELFYMCVL